MPDVGGNLPGGLPWLDAPREDFATSMAKGGQAATALMAPYRQGQQYGLQKYQLETQRNAEEAQALYRQQQVQTQQAQLKIAQDQAPLHLTAMQLQNENQQFMFNNKVKAYKNVQGLAQDYEDANWSDPQTQSDFISDVGEDPSVIEHPWVQEVLKNYIPTANRAVQAKYATDARIQMNTEHWDAYAQHGQDMAEARRYAADVGYDTALDVAKLKTDAGVQQYGMKIEDAARKLLDKADFEGYKEQAISVRTDQNLDPQQKLQAINALNRSFHIGHQIQQAPSPSSSSAPVSTPNSFNSVDEMKAAKLPKGTKVIVGGVKGSAQ